MSLVSLFSCCFLVASYFPLFSFLSFFHFYHILPSFPHLILIPLFVKFFLLCLCFLSSLFLFVSADFLFSSFPFPIILFYSILIIFVDNISRFLFIHFLFSEWLPCSPLAFFLFIIIFQVILFSIIGVIWFIRLLCSFSLVAFHSSFIFIFSSFHPVIDYTSTRPYLNFQSPSLTSVHQLPMILPSS